MKKSCVCVRACVGVWVCVRVCVCACVLVTQIENSRSIRQNNTVVDIFNTWNLPKSQAEHAAGSSLSRPPFQCAGAASRVWVLGRLAHLNGWPPHPIGGTALQPGRWATLGTSASKARGKAVPRGRWARLAMSVKAV